MLFRSARGVICNAPAEARLVFDVYGAEEMCGKTAVVGMGFDFQEPLSVPKGNYLLYSGRKEEGKNLHKLIEWFGPIHAKYPHLELVLVGSGEINFLKTLPPGVSDRGFVSEEEKRRLMSGALAFCQPSVNESFSIVLLEAWLERTATLVHADCPVTKEHAVTSRGGLYFGNAEELFAVVERLLHDEELRNQLAENGYRYVREEYSWEATLRRLESALCTFGYGEPLSTASGAESDAVAEPSALSSGVV